MSNGKENIELDNKISFSATYKQKREALSNALDPKIEKDDNGNITYEEYMWVEDFDDTYVYVEKSIWTADNYERKYGRFSYTYNEETLTATISGEFEEMVLVWLTLEENQKLQDDRNSIATMSQQISDYEIKVVDFESQINILNTEISTLKASNEELTNYKNNNEKVLYTTKINNVFAKFDEVLKENQDYIAFKENVEKDIVNYSVESVDEKLSAIFGKLQFSKIHKKPQEKVSASVIEGVDDEVKPLRYGKYEKFINKILK